MKSELIIGDEVDYKKIDSNYTMFIGYSCGGLYYSCLIDNNYFKHLFPSIKVICYDDDNTELYICDENNNILFDYNFDYDECKLYHPILKKFYKVKELIRIDYR